MIIDCDSHYLPLDVYKYVSERHKKYLPTYTYVDGVPKVEGFDPIKFHDNPDFSRHSELPGITDIGARLIDLEKMGVDIQVVAPQDLALRFNYSVDTDLAVEMCHSYNLSILGLNRKKFIPVGYVPLQSIEDSITEMLWLKSQGINQIYVDFVFPSHEQKFCNFWRNQKNIDKFLEAVEANNVILYTHHFMHRLPLDHSQFIDKRFNARMNFTDFIDAFMSDFIFGGILDRFPNLKIVIAESPGQGAALVKTIQMAINLYNEGNYKCLHPIDYIRKNFYTTIDIEMEEVIKNFLQYFGEDRMLFSTDYPHVDPAGLNKWNDTTDLKKANLSDEARDKIAYKNAVQLFNLQFG